MIWPLLLAATLALLLIQHLVWRRRIAGLKDRAEKLDRECHELNSKSEHALAEADARQEALFNSMGEGVLVLTADLRIQLANRAVEQLFGIGGPIRGLTIIEAFRLHELAELVDRVAREGQVLGCELPLRGDPKRWVQINGSRISGPGSAAAGIVLVFHDLTRIKALENVRREFVANVSHELRTPLSLIKGCVETLVDGAKDDPEAAAKFLQMIDKHTNRLIFLIEDLLAISKLESGQISLSIEPLELRSLVNAVFDDLQARAAERQIQLTNSVAPDIQVHADRERLEQVFYNLIDNAIKYGRQAGNVRVHVRQLEHKVEMAVTDDGSGIPADARERIFERFFRVDRARAREQGGTGLGLSIVKHIVQSHGGGVWVESEPGKGSTFWFTIPNRVRLGE